ncbi:MAG: glucuronate isomerase [Defluviitaleaceae bacterium]|nr:glucuronate isomerase [Defluviitaleaceae bacterium]
MKKFLDDDFLLTGETAKILYHEYAKDMPIVDFHNHLNAKEIYENKKFDNITELWLSSDHYKWRALRTLGFSENLVTGDGSAKDKFMSWAITLPYLIGNPLFHWSHLELKRYFGIDDILNEKTAEDIFEKCNEMLQKEQYKVIPLLEMQKVRVLCTTDDPIDSLKYHNLIKKDETIQIEVLPSFRPDKVINIDEKGFNEWVDKLSDIAGFKIEKLDELLQALEIRIKFFEESGCKTADNGIDNFVFENSTFEEAENVFLKIRNNDIHITKNEIIKYKSYILLYLAKSYHKRNWVMQLHIGALRENNTRMVKELGPNSGYDSIGNSINVVKLSNFLNALDIKNELPKTIIYNINPSDNHKIVTLMQCFQDGIIPGKIQFGSGWWFMDTKDGITNQIKDLAANGVVSKFVGMLTDSRSFLSFPRHEYFRRIICNIFGEYVESGEYPNDIEFLGNIIKNICFYNSMEYFGFKFNKVN